MRQPWKTILSFALLGIVVAAAAYALAALHDYTRPMTEAGLTATLVSMFLCPPQFLFVLCIDCEINGWGGLIMYSIIGVLNAGLYAAIGAVVFRALRTPTSSSGTS